MTRTLKFAAVLSVVAACGAGRATAGSEGQGKQWKKGQGWEAFARTFDGNSDSRIAKDEMLAKHPGFDLNAARAKAFDKIDKNADGFVEQSEFTPDAQKQLS